MLLTSRPCRVGGVADFVEDAEDGVGIDAAEGEIVVGVFAVVEMESAEHLLVEQPGDDLFDVTGR